MKMLKKIWHSLSIRTQLVLLMVILFTIIELGTLGLVHWFDQKERRASAIEQAKTLSHSLNQDLLKALFNSTADSFADISFRISGFEDVKTLLVLNQQEKTIFQYGEKHNIDSKDLKQLKKGKLLFTADGDLLVWAGIKADDYNYGHTIIKIDSTRFEARRKEHLVSLLLIFPLELLIGFIISWRISRSYTKPFKLLASAMQNNNVRENTFLPVETQAKNEIGSLFSGYNEMIRKVESTTNDIRFQSEHDSLTGLLNRYAIEIKINQTLQGELGTSHTLLSVDLDQFKVINDSIGHVAGDELLKMVSHSCKQHIPKDGEVARVGGDDFFILLANSDKEQGLQIANKILANLSDFRFFWEGEAISVSASIGFVNFKPHEYTLEELIKAVDAAFYTAKASGRNKLHVYEAGGQQVEQFNTEIKIASYLKEALREGPARFELYAQTLVNLQEQTDKVSYEVLIRMFDSHGEFLSPDSFLGTAERYQMMVEIDIFVLLSYLKMAQAHPEHINNLATVHINLAGGTLNNPDFQQALKQAIQTYDFPWKRLELEVTETSAVGNLSQASDFINYCQSQGIGFALDDFGTGMASFEYLKNLPFNVVKIDGSFVRDMLSDPVDHAMIRYTQDICQLKQQKTVAEYVENEAEMRELTKIGITYGQGYFLGKPKPLIEWMDNRSI